jgi:DNA-binding beta-propeller fold protein YncE
VLNGWTVFDANTCNATVQAGCGDLGYLSGDPAGPFDAEVDYANDTLYTANYDNTISAFDLADCNGSDLADCAKETPGTVTPFPSPGFEHSLWLAVDAANHSVYVAYQKDDALLVIDADKCDGTDPAGCATLTPPEIHTGADPESVVLDPQTQTLYTANEVDNDVSVIDAARCDAQTTSGCRHPAPEVAIPAGGLAADPAVATTYVPTSSTAVAMTDTNECNAFHASGCSARPPTLTVGANPGPVTIDPATHTVYVANAGAGSTGSVTVFNDRTCNATDQTGCGTISTLQVPGGKPDAIAVNPLTDTIYVATITDDGPDLISVFSGATCDTTDANGCNQAPATIAVGSSGGAPNNSSLEVAINPATNTIYASNVFNTGPRRFSVTACT